MNPSKTKDFIVGFRKHSITLATLQSHEEHLEKENITGKTKRAQQRLHFPRVLKKFKLDDNLLLTFYRPSFGRLLTLYHSIW